MKAHNISEALTGIVAGEVRSSEQDEAAFSRLASFNDGAVYAGRFSGQSPWERHPDADELLYVLDGEVDITLLTRDGSVRETIPAGSVFVVPKGLWHRQLAKPSVTLVATPDHSQVSHESDPRRSE